MSSSARAPRRLLAPEVIQTSAMDCGPATLRSLLEGFGIAVSYGRLREACQTDLDGTSIDTLEEIAVRLGLDAEQILVPPDHLFLSEARALPAIVVVRLPSGAAHFVVVWRRIGRFAQVMDPAKGRYWVDAFRFSRDLHLHPMPVPAATWREWAGSEEFRGALGRRLRRLGMKADRAERRIERALADPGWTSIARLDAAARMAESLARSGALARGRESARALESFTSRTVVESSFETPDPAIPRDYWMVRALAPSESDAGEERLLARGAVLVRARGRSPEPIGRDTGPPLSPELAAALAERPVRPAREILRLMREDGLFAPSLLAAAIALAAGAVLVEAVLFRSLFDLGRDLGLSGQRLAAMLALALFGAAILLLEIPTASGLLRVGRKLEGRLRTAFLGKIPRLGDRYFRSRLSSDMAERGHAIHRLRVLPHLGGMFLRSVFELVFITAGILWIDPAAAPLALVAAAAVVALPLLAHPALSERELRARTHLGALGRFYLEAMLGLVAVKAHGAEPSFRREHESLLVEWARSALHLQRAVVTSEAVQAAVAFALAAALVFGHVSGATEPGMVLLLVYWSLHLPGLGQEISILARQYPSHRNATLRLLEPLGAPEDEDATRGAPALSPTAGASRGVAIAFERVSVRSSGRPILESIDLAIEPGAHIAILGPSGAGKSSLVGVLLGWHRPYLGGVAVDGRPLDGPRLERLRGETAWVDPDVRLWNRTLLSNLLYGVRTESHPGVGWAISEAELREVLERLPDGLQSRLGEGGGLVSGGEGQRIRLARALLREGTRLVILDEPFRGLDRAARRELLARARRRWERATLLCVTHDVAETEIFDRVIVLERGRIVEQGTPSSLAAAPGSRYRALLEAEKAALEALWERASWRRMRLDHGMIFSSSEAPASAGSPAGRSRIDHA